MMLPEKKRRVTVSGGELAYVDAGEGPAVVLLHGFPTSSFLWRGLVHLLEPWFRVIAPDLLGYGNSDKPADAALGIVPQTRYVLELLESLRVDRFAAVGHSHGGGIAQLLALDGAGVEALVLFDAIAFEEWPADALEELKRTPTSVRGESLVRAVLLAGFDLAMGHRERLSGADVEEYLRPWMGEEGWRAFFRALDSIDGEGLAGREEELSRIECPAFLVWGEDDPFLPPSVAERLADVLPDAALALLPGCSHFVTEDAPDTVGPLVLEWLRARYLGHRHGHDASAPVSIPLQRKNDGKELP